ncbi:MAG: DnaJ domain-containing protein [Nitrosopumilus sp.]|nr:DnaJ domain-containing protein [Nitrosopumilus sp.]
MEIYLDSEDYYKILGVMNQSSYHEIKRAYRHLARKYHPDRNSDVSDDIMKKINIAFEVLSDSEKRKQYDITTFDDVFENKGKIMGSSSMNSNNINGGNYESKFESRVSSNPTPTKNDSYSNQYSDANFDLLSHSTEIATGTNNFHPIQGRYHIIVEPSLCLAFGSCETLAPKVFIVEKNRQINPKAVVKSETGADFETILDAAKTCPTKAIIIIDRYSGERIYP